MDVQTAAAERSGPNLPAFLKTKLDRSQQSYLIFDHARRVMHTSSGLGEVLRLDEPSLPPHADVVELLARAAGNDKETLRSIEQWLEQTSPEKATGLAAESLVLLTAVDARTVHVHLNPVGEHYWIVAFEDVTGRNEAETQMLAIAYQDQLTGIGNRALFEHKLDRALVDLCAAEGERASVLFLDLDRFKIVNDTLGHAVGDGLLRLVSERLQSSLRASDTLARLGGDEFAILLVQTSGKEMTSALAARIIDLIQRPYLVDGQVINVGVSIGIAVAPADGSSRTELLKSADLALYHSKASGRGVFHFFQPVMEERAQWRRAIELDLRKALVLRQFELHYRPQIDSESKAILGLEGLLRWRHPQRGLMLPEDFFPLAEELGLAVSIGEWVLKTACREATRWPDSVTVAVNISPLQFEMGKFAASVERALSAADLPGNRLEIDVTEDILLRDGEIVLGTLKALREQGVRVAMARFGIGMASMSQLVNFPFDKIKIDQSLTGDDDGRHRAIVRAICALGQGLGISTMAEGVTTQEHLKDVQAEGCGSITGFYHSEALPAAELAMIFANRQLVPTPLEEVTKGQV